MSLFDRYIIRQILTAAGFALAIFMIIMILGNVYQEMLRKLADRPDLGLGIFFDFIGVVIPLALSYTLPFSFLMAVLLVFGRLSADNEFISMKMAGLGLWRICRPVFLLGLLFTIICLFLNVAIVPKCNNSKDDLKANMINYIKKDPLLLFADGKVTSELDGWKFFGKKNGSTMENFQFVKIEKGGNEPEFIGIAKSADIASEITDTDTSIFFTMKEQNVLIAEKDGVGQIAHIRESPFARSMGDLVSSAKRKSLEPDNVSVTQLLSLMKDESLTPERRSSYRTEFHIRLAGSMSCVIYGLMAVPLGVTSQRRESTAGFVIALGLAVGYHVLSIFAKDQHDSPEMFPHILVWVPNVLFFVIGAVLFYRLSRK